MDYERIPSGCVGFLKIVFGRSQYVVMEVEGSDLAQKQARDGESKLFSGQKEDKIQVIHSLK